MAKFYYKLILVQIVFLKFGFDTLLKIERLHYLNLAKHKY